MDTEPRLADAPDGEPIVILADAPNPVPPTPPSSGGGFDKSKLILPGAILLAAVMISGSVLFARLSAGTPNPAGQPKSNKPVNIEIGNSPVLGDKNAPVTIVEFGDYQCPFCKRYFETVKSSILNEYVNTGKAKFVWKDYAFLGQESLWAAQAARCAGDQGKFWEYHDYLYSHQGGENVVAFSKSNLKKFATALGLNAGTFNTCLDTDKHLSAVQQETQYSSSIGVNGTPATYINGRLAADGQGNSIGAAPYPVFKALIDVELQ